MEGDVVGAWLQVGCVWTVRVYGGECAHVLSDVLLHWKVFSSCDKLREPAENKGQTISDNV